MLITDVYANGFFFDIELDETHPVVEKAMLLFTEEQLRDAVAGTFTNLGLTYDNLEENNLGATWAITSKAASHV